MDPRWYLIIGGTMVFTTVTVGETWHGKDELELGLDPHPMEELRVVLRPTEPVVTRVTSGGDYDTESYILNGLPSM